MRHFYFLFLIICLSSTISAQEEIPQEFNYNFIGVDLSVITKGDFMLGIKVGSLKSKDIGFFAGFKMSFQSPDEKLVYDNIGYLEAKNTYGDDEREEKHRYMDFSVGISKKLFWNNFYLLLGLSYQIDEIFREFYDNFHILGNDGTYYVKPDTKSGVGGNVSFVFRVDPKSSLTLGVTFGEFNLVSAGYNWAF